MVRNEMLRRGWTVVHYVAILVFMDITNAISERVNWILVYNVIVPMKLVTIAQVFSFLTSAR